MTKTEFPTETFDLANSVSTQTVELSDGDTFEMRIAPVAS